MKLKYFILAGMIAVSCSGCLWPFGASRSPASLSISAPMVIVQVQQPGLFAKGGKLVFIPFTAGLNAVADQQLDRLSLMIVKGASDTFQEGASAFQMIDQGDPNTGDLVLEGHIEDYRPASRRNLIGLGKSSGVLEVKATLKLRRTNEILAVVSARKEFQSTIKAESLAYEVGSEIASQLMQEVRNP